MSKFLCLLSASISALILLVYLLDIVVGVPFKKANSLLDIIFIIFAAGVATLSVLTLRSVK
ncbi:MAG: hypothetical protein Q4G03_06320 [Planctomycetia bacterium]|nr:hypothetical protein [Planctomycetia bacterium]